MCGVFFLLFSPGKGISQGFYLFGRNKVQYNNFNWHVLNTPHFEEVSIEFDPFMEKNPIAVIKEHLERVHPEASIILTIRGYINSERIGMSEAELVTRMREITKEKCAKEPSFEFRDIHVILEDDLFKNFVSKLEHYNYDEARKRQLRDLAIKAMMVARA